MAVVNLKSDAITDIDADIITKLGPTQLGGVVREAVGHVQTNSDDSIGSTFRMVRVPSRARVSAVLLHLDGAPIAGAANIGVYEADEGAVVDADFFASAYDLTTAAANADVTFESGEVAVEDRGKRLWEQLGLSEDPNKEYDIVLTLTAAVDAASDLLLKAQYVLPD